VALESSCLLCKWGGAGPGKGGVKRGPEVKAVPSHGSPIYSCFRATRTSNETRVSPLSGLEVRPASESRKVQIRTTSGSLLSLEGITPLSKAGKKKPHERHRTYLTGLKPKETEHKTFSKRGVHQQNNRPVPGIPQNDTERRNRKGARRR